MQVTVEIFDDETQKILKSIKENTSDCEIISVRPANGQKPNGTSGPYYPVKPPFDPDFMQLRICLSFASFLSKVSAKRAQKENMSKTRLFESRALFLAKG